MFLSLTGNLPSFIGNKDAKFALYTNKRASHKSLYDTITTEVIYIDPCAFILHAKLCKVGVRLLIFQ